MPARRTQPCTHPPRSGAGEAAGPGAQPGEGAGGAGAGPGAGPGPARVGAAGGAPLIKDVSFARDDEVQLAIEGDKLLAHPVRLVVLAIPPPVVGPLPPRRAHRLTPELLREDLRRVGAGTPAPLVHPQRYLEKKLLWHVL